MDDVKFNLNAIVQVGFIVCMEIAFEMGSEGES
jgi:hypothetical protein